MDKNIPYTRLIEISNHNPGIGYLSQNFVQSSLYKKDDNKPWVLDFTDGKDWLQNPDNYLNLLRFYSALIDGNTITISKAEDGFDRPGRRSDSWIAELTIYGVSITKDDFLVSGEPYRQGKVNDFINEFFKNTYAPRTSVKRSRSETYRHIFHTEPISFFELISKQKDYIDSLKVISAHVDFENLNVYASKELSPIEQEAWDTLFRYYEDKGKLDKIEQLEAFIALFFKIYEKGKYDSILYKFGVVYSYSKYDIVINSKFYRALYLNNIIHYSFE